jgi:hypothetical protein
MDEMGLGNGLLPDSALTASSVRMPFGQYGPAMARLHSASGWRPAHDTMQEYLTVIYGIRFQNTSVKSVLISKFRIFFVFCKPCHP